MLANRLSLAPVLALAVLGAGGSAGCRKTSAANATPADAGAASASTASASDAAAPNAYTGRLEAHIVAHGSYSAVRLIDLQSGQLVLGTALFGYELTADGAAHMIGDAALYAQQLPKDDDQLGGYEVEPLPYSRKLPLPAAFTMRELHDVRLDGETHGREIDPSWSIGKEIDLPDGFTAVRLARAADGTTIVIGRGSPTGPPTTVIAVKGSKLGKVLGIPELGEAPNERLNCEHVPSWATPHLRCYSWNETTTIHRLTRDRWERVKRTDEAKSDVTSAAVGYDDTLWLGLRGEVMRITKAGAVDTIAIPTPDASPDRASYHSGESYGVSKGKPSADGLGEHARRWESVGVQVDGEARPVDRISQIVPRPDGEAWVVAGASGIAVIAHLGKPPIARWPAPITIGTEPDQRNEVRNTRPPKPWVGHCAQLFVPLAKQRADGSFDSAAAWARQKQIATLVEKARGPASPTGETPRAAMVEGRLGGRRAAGILVWRASPTASEELMEKAVNAIAEDQTKVAGIAPDVTCTAPVLERAVVF